MYQPRNSKKYEGDPSKIVYRSSWERLFMEWLDLNPDVISFQSEEFYIPYISPVDNRQHRYFVDFKVKFANGSTLLIEIKPAHQTKKPVPRKGKKVALLESEVRTYAVNYAKWKAENPDYPWVAHASGYTMKNCWLVGLINHRSYEAATKQAKIFARWIAEYKTLTK